jgi:hypothetical protein
MRLQRFGFECNTRLEVTGTSRIAVGRGSGLASMEASVSVQPGKLVVPRQTSLSIVATPPPIAKSISRVNTLVLPVAAGKLLITARLYVLLYAYQEYQHQNDERPITRSCMHFRLLLL